MHSKALHILIIIIAAYMMFLGTSHASSNIDPNHSYAWSNKGGWINFNTPEGNVTVESNKISGYAWSANFGWIDFSPTNSGVVNDTNGILTGYAWGRNTGYIDFSSVTIDSEGYFHGYATNPILGTISFNCDNTSSCGASDFKVRTLWKATEVTNISGGDNAVGYTGAGGGDIGYIPPPIPMESEILHGSPDDTKDEEEICGASGYDERVAVEDIMRILETCDECETEVVSRAEFLQALYPPQCYVGKHSVYSPFPDVRSADRGYDAIIHAYKDGIVQGYGDGFFRPSDAISYAEVLKILLLYYYLDERHSPILAMIINVGVSDAPWFATYFEIAKEKSLSFQMHTLSHPTYAPTDVMSRGDILTLLEVFDKYLSGIE